MSNSPMASLIFAVGIIGTVLSLLVFASPIKTFYKVVKKKSTENYKGAPYITTFLCTSLWTSYGVLKPGGFQIAIVNGAGAIFHCIYILLFLVYSPQDQKVKTALSVAILDVGFLGTVISVILFALHGTIQLTALGMLCSGLTIIMYASPLLVMKTVIQTKSVEYMPFLLSFFMFLNAGVWALYSFLVKDFFIGIPNLIGLILGSTQLTIYAIYKKKSNSTKVPSVSLDLEKGDMLNVMKMEVHNSEDAKLNDEAIEVVLKRVKSLPKPVLNRENTFRRILKTLSFGPNNLPSTFCSAKPKHEDVDIQIGVEDQEDQVLNTHT
ncbi:bidirectional sugar transporter SWEET17 [Cajanus cajan]|uniref:bidirectional sugar transporter SWEET17 n=1 Tax=Cajanus cajan TaxID=3821 RepID=UPI00098DA7A9|nr:bidirectional sugar transporter SWEET17 [Cajanus cajan]